MIKWIFKATIFCLFISAIPASAQSCRQALILGLDVSLSVNLFELRLQCEGLARALVDDLVMDALVPAAGNRVELVIFEWSGQYGQSPLVDWTAIESRETLKEISASLIERPQETRTGRTALRAAMLYARNMLHKRSNCMTQTLDLSGDGRKNNGILPDFAKPKMDAARIAFNALVIGLDGNTSVPDENEIAHLSRYFRDNVIVGPSSFVETVVGFENYAGAIKRKLLRELLPSMVQGDRLGRLRTAADVTDSQSQRPIFGQDTINEGNMPNL